MLSSEGQLLRLLKWSGEYVSLSGKAQQWRSASLALEGVGRGESEKVLSLEALPKQRIEAIDHTKMLGSGKAFATRQEALSGERFLGSTCINSYSDASNTDRIFNERWRTMSTKCGRRVRS
jgi:hypothetical protein